MNNWNESQVPKEKILIANECLAGLMETTPGKFFLSLQVNGQVYAISDYHANQLAITLQAAMDALVKDRSKGGN